MRIQKDHINVLNSLLSTATKMEKAFLLIFTDCLTDGTLVHDLTSGQGHERERPRYLGTVSAIFEREE